jgi:CheY-like chemotaxis protein
MPASILVVEDNRANMDLTEFLLKASGYTPMLARGGAEGVRLATEQRPDLILMDIQMPDMDGYEATAAIRRDPDLAACPVVAVTAFAMVGDRDHILSHAFAGYISKPIEAETFVTQVEAYLPPGLCVSRGAANEA